MYRPAFVAILLGSGLMGCHPPDQQIYNDSKNCVGVFDVALKRIPSGEFRKAGLYSDEVDRTSLEAFEGALESGTKLGLTNQAVSKDVDEAKRRAWHIYGNAGGVQPSGKLLSAVKQCMPKPAGPND